jgi:hypothetical protein
MMAGRLIAGRGLIEVRRTVLKPNRKTAWLDALTPKHTPGLLACLVPELGADEHEVITLHAYDDYDARDARPKPLQHVQQEGRVLRERSEVYVEALECIAAAGAGDKGATAFTPAKPYPAPVYEWREYQLELGYNPIPKLREAFVDGLPSKVAADSHKRGELAMMGWTDIGLLNRFVELWRYESVQEAMRARESARTSAEWRKTIGTIAPMVQSFSTAFYRPSPHSPWQ